MKRFAFIVFIAMLLLLPSHAPAQMQHAVIYTPTKTGHGALIPDTGGCKIRHIWHIRDFKESSIWYAYLGPDEIQCLEQTGTSKMWLGPSAKEAWKNAYTSGLPDAKEVVEAAVKVPMTVFDAEQGRQVEKMVSVAEAKALDDRIDVAEKLTDAMNRTDDSMLPRKIFDGSK